jgi:hypothetical protein
MPDIQVTVDFAYNWNSETDDPLHNEFDFFSVILHELTHGLGILSLANSDGSSEIGNSNPGVYTTYDRLLETGNGKRLFDFAGVFLGTPSDLIGFDNGIVFWGPTAFDFLGFQPRVFSPNPWDPGSSLGHWSVTNSAQSVMLPTMPLGVKKRMYLPYELGALADLGFQVDLPQPMVSGVSNWDRYE